MWTDWFNSPISSHIKCGNHKRWASCHSVLSPLWRSPSALHLCVNIAFYVCSRMFAWYSQAQRKSAQGTSHLQAQVEKTYACEIVYSGNKTENTGMDQVVLWCNLWILPIKWRCFSNNSPNLMKKEGLLKTIHHLLASPGSQQSLLWFLLFFSVRVLTHYAIPMTVQFNFKACTVVKYTWCLYILY